MKDTSLTILMLVTKRQYRGAEISAFNLSKSLLEKGHRILWVGLYPHRQGHIVTLDGAVNIDLPASSSWLSIKKLKALASLYKEHNPHIVQANGSDTLRYVVFLKILGFSPKIVYRNISILSTWINSRPKYILFKFLFSKTDKVISVGEEALTDFRNFFPFSADKSLVIHRGVPLISSSEKEISKIREQYSIQKEDFVFIHIGHFSAEKNHTFLLKAWQQLTSKHNNIKLVLLGDGILRDAISNEMREFNLSNTVLMPGLQTNIADWLAISKVMVLCSTIEGVPGVVVEASFQGVPTVAVNVGGVKEVLIDGENGLLVPTHDIDQFVQNCEKLLMDDNYRQTLGNKAKTIVRERFDLDNNTNQFVAVYNSIL
ncbi:MAG: glycosyltransferase [Bacteroidota bacterium]